MFYRRIRRSQLLNSILLQLIPDKPTESLPYPLTLYRAGSH